MKAMKKLTAAAFMSLMVLAVAHGMDSSLTQEQAGKQQAAVSPDEIRILERAAALRKDNKTEEALAVLREGMDQFPASARILNEALQIYMAEKRNDEALRLLDDRAKNFPEIVRKRIRSAKLSVLQSLIERLLEEGKTEKAFDYLQQMADAGYRGFHQLRHNALYEPLRRHAGFEEIMKRISENTGLDRPPRDFSVTLTSGGAYTLSARKGKVVLVDFWSTSCPPCIEELPNVRAIYQANKEKGFEVVSISLDDNKEKLEAFLADHPMPWNTVFSGKGWNDDTAKIYEISSIPSLWLVDKKGILRYFDVRGEDLKAAVEKLLRE
jgi:pentatricopeptide repeat protein